MKQLIRTAGLISIAAIAVACSSESAPPSQSAKRQANIVSPALAEQIPSYELIHVDTRKDRHRTLRVRLQAPVLKAQLETLAQSTRYRVNGRNLPTKTFYYLEGQDSGGIAWAITRFDPELSVEILGPTAESMALAKATSRANGEVVGAWLDSSSMTGAHITIVKRGSDYFAESKGHGDADRVSVSKLKRGVGKNQNRYTSSDEDMALVYVVMPAGDLEVRDDEGETFMRATAVKG